MIILLDMKTSEEQAILDLIEEIYEKKYIGKLTLTKTDESYTLKLGLNNSEKPLTLSS